VTASVREREENRGVYNSNPLKSMWNSKALTYLSSTFLSIIKNGKYHDLPYDLNTMDICDLVKLCTGKLAQTYQKCQWERQEAEMGDADKAASRKCEELGTLRGERAS
jgi:hypothetical protein